MPVMKKPTQAHVVQQGLDILPEWLSQMLTDPDIAMGAVQPLSAFGPLEGPLAKLAAKFKALRKAPTQPLEPTNVGDMLLREHLAGSPRMREFVPVGEEGAGMREVSAAVGKEPEQVAYETILNGTGRVKPSPSGSGGLKPIPAHEAQWPTPEDLQKLKESIGEGRPKRRKLWSGRPLDE